MKTVKLYGWLGEKYGKVFHLEIATAAEAVRALCANFPDFKADVARDDVEFAVITGKRNGLSKDQLADPLAGDTLKIVPMPTGAKSGGIFQTIIGIVLIVVGVVLNAVPGGSAFSPYLINAGIALVLSGVATMLTGTPKAPKVAETEAPENRASDLFNGPVNTSAQGNPVPVCYGGPIRVGSYVVSAGYSTKDIGV